MTEREALDRAKDLIRAQLLKSENGAVQLLASLAELPDDLPQVQTVAAAVMHAAGGARPC